MISVIVERAPGDKQGPDISDSLITSEQTAVERGRNEIDEHFSHREIISSSGPLTGFMRPGKIIEVADSEQQIWRGMIKTCAIVITSGQDSYSRDINLTVEREA